MQNKIPLIVMIGMMFGLLLAAGGAVLAGSLNPSTGPTDPGSQMYTLDDIYTRLTTGVIPAKQTTFTEPASGPGTGTMRTLDEIMAAANPQGASAPRVPKTGHTACYNNAGTVIACAGTGQDGEYQRGVVPVSGPVHAAPGGVFTIVDEYYIPAWTGQRFTDNGNGTVTDNLTTMIWLKNGNCADLAGTNSSGKATWETALAAANALANGTCGLTDGSVAGDWRMSNVNELTSLMDLTQSNPALPNGHPFTASLSLYPQSSYWTSTSFLAGSSFAFTVSSDTGQANVKNKANTLESTWPVRGGQ